MTTMRVPSVDLIRALRRITSSSFCEAGPTFSHTSRAQIRHVSRSAVSHAQSSASASAPVPTRAHPHAGGQSPQISRGRMNPNAPASRDRGPESTEDTQTDFGLMDIYSNTPEPATSIDACTPGGFHLNNGTKIVGGTGVLLAGGEAWSWRPWLGIAQSPTSGVSGTGTAPRISDLLDKLGRLQLPPTSLALLKILHPKPDLMIVGTGSRTLMLAPETRQYLSEELGLRLDVMDTANASAAYNLLAKERGVEGGAGIGAVMLPVGWKGKK